MDQVQGKSSAELTPYPSRWKPGIVELTDPNKPEWQGSGLYESASDHGRGVTIS